VTRQRLIKEISLKYIFDLWYNVNNYRS